MDTKSGLGICARRVFRLGVHLGIHSSAVPVQPHSAIWNEIALKSKRLGASSPTQAMKAIYHSRVDSIDAYLRAFIWAERECSHIFAMGQEGMGLDLMDHPHAMPAMLPKLVRLRVGCRRGSALGLTDDRRSGGVPQPDWESGVAHPASSRYRGRCPVDR